MKISEARKKDIFKVAEMFPPLIFWSHPTERSALKSFTLHKIQSII